VGLGDLVLLRGCHLKQGVIHVLSVYGSTGRGGGRLACHRPSAASAPAFVVNGREKAAALLGLGAAVRAAVDLIHVLAENCCLLRDFLSYWLRLVRLPLSKYR